MLILGTSTFISEYRDMKEERRNEEKRKKMEENREKKQQQVWWKKRTSVTVDETTPLTGNAVSCPPDVDLECKNVNALRHRSIGSFSEIDEGYMSSYSFRDFSDNLAQSIPYMAR